MTTGPLHALQVWLRHEVEEPDLELVCSEHPDPTRGDRSRTVVRLTVCARALSGHELAELLLVGARTVTVRLDGCTDPVASLAAVEAVAHILRAAGVDRLRTEGVAGGSDETAADPTDRVDQAQGERGGRGKRRPVLDGAHLPVPRRRLLGLGTDVERALPDMDAAPPTRLASAVRALAGVSAVAAPQAEPDGLSDIDSPAVVLAAPGCTACGVCVLACPTQALSLQHHGGGAVAISTLLQSPSACDGCLRCVELCPASALTVTRSWRWSDLLTDTLRGVATVSTATCTRCSTPFPTTSGERLCPVCRYRRAHPFGSTPPPATPA